jgi:hypothetical protein
VLFNESSRLVVSSFVLTTMDVGLNSPADPERHAGGAGAGEYSPGEVRRIWLVCVIAVLMFSFGLIAGALSASREGRSASCYGSRWRQLPAW